MVYLYASPTTRAYFAKGGLDTNDGMTLWETFLRKFNFPYQLLSSPDQLESIKPGVLVLPSSVALSEREKLAVTNFRGKGGGVLASWLTGVRGETGEWRGFDFMEKTLDVGVLGTTEGDEETNFMMPHGDNPVTHFLPAGYRVWLERVKETYPLRLTGAHSAAHIMDWSRNFEAGKTAAAIIFDERGQGSAAASRSVVLGYAERLWLSADRKLMESIAYDSLMWLLRQPVAYTAAWPFPRTSAVVLAVEAADVLSDSDVTVAKMVKQAGGLASYYVLSSNAVKSAKALQQIQAMGHEVAYFGDSFDNFKDQPANVQAGRLDTMRTVTKEAGIAVAQDAGFNAPMETYDKATEKLLRERSFGSLISSMDVSEARLPLIDPLDVGAVKPMIILPRTQRGIEAVLLENFPATGLAIFLDELDIGVQMSGLSVVTVPTQSIVTDDEWARLFAHLSTRRDRIWMASAGQVADWWRERARVTTRFDTTAAAPLLVATINGQSPLRQPVAILVNLPSSESVMRLVASDRATLLPKIVRVDAWRAAVVLDGIAPGEYRWSVYFDH